MPINRGLIEVFDDFLAGPATATENVWHQSADTGGSSAQIADGTANLGGRWRLATDTTDNDMSEGPCSGLNFEVQAGLCIVEYRMMIETGAVASVAINAGFNDDPTDASNSLPAELSTATWTSNAATFAGIVYDPDATNDDWHAFWVDDDVDSASALADLRFSNTTPTADKWVTLRTELQDRGSGQSARAIFSIWDEAKTPTGYYEKAFATSIDRDAALCAYFAMENRDAVAHNVDVDYIYICASRGVTA